jgi:hypothetical protein
MEQQAMVELIIESSNGERIRSVEDWLRFAPPERGEAQWRDFRSAKELARAWFRTGMARVPSELSGLFDTSSETSGLNIERCVAEQPMRLDALRGNTRRCDLVLYGRQRDENVLVAIEAKADEEFGPIIGPYRAQRANTRSKVPERIDALLAAILGRSLDSDDSIGLLRYQLLHGIAGALVDAGERGCARAVFLVHEFRSVNLDAERVERNSDDLNGFVQALSRGAITAVRPGVLVGPLTVPGGGLVPTDVPLFVGKVLTPLDADGSLQNN